VKNLRKSKRFISFALALVLTLGIISAIPVAAAEYLIDTGDWFGWSVSYSISPEASVGEELDQWEQTITVNTVSVGDVLTLDVGATRDDRPIGFGIYLFPEGDWANRNTLVEHELLWSDIEQGEFANFMFEPLPVEEQILFEGQTVTYVFDTPGEFRLRASYIDGWQNAGNEEIKVVVTDSTTAATPEPEPIVAETTTPEPVIAPTSGMATGTVVNCYALRVRASGSMGNNIIGWLARGDTVTVLDNSRPWVQIQFKDGVGWVFGGFIQVN
jgi:hypothetical protein